MKNKPSERSTAERSKPIVFRVTPDTGTPKVQNEILFSTTTQDDTLADTAGTKVATIGIGEKALSRRSFYVIPRRILAFARAKKIRHFRIRVSDILGINLTEAITPKERVELFIIGFEMANFEFIKYKSKPKEGWTHVEEVEFITTNEHATDVKDAIKHGTIVAEAINEARVLSNTPGGEMTPDILFQDAKKLAKGSKANVSALSPKEMRKLGMGGILGVAQGSAEEPRLIVVEYRGGLSTKDAPLVLVGKGITFDTGGLNLKPTNAIYEMHLDMSGGAAVIASVVAAAKLGVKKNIIGLIPAAENMPSGSSYRPGDILRTMSGTTIEITNTDAEGRVVLADALTYAERYKPRLVVDVATLTGASMVALGTRMSALFSNSEELSGMIRKLGDESGDYVWPMPLWEEYERDIRGTFGDFVNSSKTPYGGAITGATFLHQFAKNYPWAHIDMAPRMTSIDEEYLAKGASGAPVRLLVKLLELY